MNRLIIAFALASTVPLTSACNPAITGDVASGSSTIGSGSTISPSSAISAEAKRAYYVALVGAVGLERGAELAVDMRIIQPGSPTAIRVADGLVKLKRAMDLGETALKANDSFQLVQQTGIIKSLTTDIKRLLGIR